MRKFYLRNAAPPPIPQTRKGPPPTPSAARKPELREKTFKSMLEFQKGLVDDAVTLEFFIQQLQKGLGAKNDEVIGFVSELRGVIKRQPELFSKSAEGLRAFVDFWTQLHDLSDTKGMDARRGLKSIWTDIAKALKEPAQKLPESERMAPSTPRKLLEHLYVEDGMDPEEAKERVSHLSDEEIEQMVGHIHSRASVRTANAIRYRGCLYLRVA